MGDLRNKFRKAAEREATEAMQRRLHPARPPEPPIRCQCGKSIYEVIIWEVAQGLRQPSKFYCLACYPGGDPPGPSITQTVDRQRSIANPAG